MRRTILAANALAAILGAACASQPDHLKMDPLEHVFKRVGEDLWWKAVAVNKQGRPLPKLTGMSWRSSDPKVATVDSVGRVKAVGLGSATITARLGKLSAEAMVQVEGVDRVSVEPQELVFEARGDAKPIAVKVFDAGGRELRDRIPIARCMNEDVCRAASDGVHPVDPGQTTLVVSAEGRKVEIPVTVTAARRH